MAESKDQHAPRIVNRRARHDFLVEDKLEVGIALTGSEVKSIRDGKVSLAEGYAYIEPTTMQLYLHNVNIAEYTHAGPTNNHEPTRRRKLLAHRRQIRALHQSTSAKGTTLVPLAMYFVRGKVKLEIGIARGKQKQDKRHKIDKKESDREIRRALSRRR